MLSTVVNHLNTYRAARVTHQSPYRAEMADLPATLYPFWKRTAQHEFKGIPQDAFFFARAAEGLMAFFDCVRHSSMRCGLPSMAADSVWHAWMRLSPTGLNAFCRKHFGRVIPHVEALDMGDGMARALAACLVHARRIERMPVAGPNLPRLFALDRVLAMPAGRGYLLFNGEVASLALDARGRAIGVPAYVHSLSPALLLAAGLISDDEYRRHARKTGTPAETGGGRGSSDSQAICVGDACEGASDAGGDSGCGGGCGGGGD
ncbi:hypothetical protein PO883_04040 [Massilia sp. DJPM01]|uniref:hypothetical protein n=1 Tax=Massilia sp. DJPM01 TaxID=3024404 RepID=UPI00259F3828|nr:hypothetical protein [Massilia sp. DJPM01]MDM5176361.1 hypothetical protein [Massilia sp. DJPM01]